MWLLNMEDGQNPDIPILEETRRHFSCHYWLLLKYLWQNDYTKSKDNIDQQPTQVTTIITLWFQTFHNGSPYDGSNVNLSTSYDGGRAFDW